MANVKICVRPEKQFMTSWVLTTLLEVLLWWDGWMATATPQGHDGWWPVSDPNLWFCPGPMSKLMSWDEPNVMWAEFWLEVRVSVTETNKSQFWPCDKLTWPEIWGVVMSDHKIPTFRQTPGSGPAVGSKYQTIIRPQIIAPFTPDWDLERDWGPILADTGLMFIFPLMSLFVWDKKHFK